MSGTNSGVLNSTEPGIHGERDSGVSGGGLSNSEITGQGIGTRGGNTGSVTQIILFCFSHDSGCVAFD